jgi:sugar phosphate isomerase/epimerase
MLASGAMTGALVAGGALPSMSRAQSTSAATKDSFRYCLNMSTIRGQELSVPEEIDIAGQAGYDAIEPWLGKLHEYVQGGGSLADLRKRIEDHGLTVESAIGFASWLVDDDDRRKSGLEEARRDMDVIASLGGKRIAAPPAGVPRGQSVDLFRAAERYRALCEIGDQIGVAPQVEMWGGNAAIGRVGTAILIAVESGHSRACFLGDVFHTYKGGSDFNGLKLLGPQALQVFHMNDYPADPPRESIGDEHRVYPGDGIAPLADILRNFLAVGAAPVLSLELFNRDYWSQDALAVARTGLEKMKSAVAAI